MEETNSKNRFNESVKRYLPVASIILLTFLLMVFFRFHKRSISKLIEEGKNNLISFYAQNLKPLFASTEITNEDVFNFALYQSLPIDKDNKKLLLVSHEGADNRVFEVKPASYIPYTDNYERFADYLELSPDEKYRVDSILGAYKKEIYLSVLKSDQNAIAINPQLGDLQKAVLADLIAFSEKVNRNKTYEIFPIKNKTFNVENLRSFAISAKEIPNNDYIFITPDTVFQTEFKFDTKAIEKLSDIDLNKHLAANNMKDNFRIEVDFDNTRKNREKIRIKPGTGIFHQMDSNKVRVIVPIPKIPTIHYTRIEDSIKVNLEKTTDKLKMLSFKWESGSKEHPRGDVNNPPRPPRRGEPIQFHFNFNPEEFAKYAANIAKGNFKDLEKFGMVMDSLGKKLEKTFSDSLKREIKNYERAMRKKQSVNINPRDTVK
ncbi:MAG: hypothetical protein KGZ42_09700 [Melioribacter sp.]|nr:hypothetical protein [Melioribacter sp.]